MLTTCASDAVVRGRSTESCNPASPSTYAITVINIKNDVMTISSTINIELTNYMNIFYSTEKYDFFGDKLVTEMQNMTEWQL